MPLYLFTVFEGETAYPDLEGTELPDLVAARQTGLRAIGELTSEAVLKGIQDFQARIEVADAQGRCVLTLNAACQVDVVTGPVASAGGSKLDRKTLPDAIQPIVDQ